MTQNVAMAGVVAAGVVAALAGGNAAWARPCEEAVATAARNSGVPAALLAAMSAQESGQNPYALNIGGKSMQAPSRESAMAAIEAAQARGTHSVDVGCMQVNLYWHDVDARAMLLAQANTAYAAAFLKRLRARHNSWHAAVAAYHAGDPAAAHGRAYACAIAGRLNAVPRLRRAVAGAVCSGTHSSGVRSGETRSGARRPDRRGAYRAVQAERFIRRLLR